VEHCDLYTLDVGVLDASKVMVLRQVVVVAVVGLERPASEVVVVVGSVSSGGVVVVRLQVVVVFQTWLA